MDIYCKVRHFAGMRGEVTFTLDKYDPKQKEGDNPVVATYDFNFPFEVWKKFKDSNIKITVEKAE